ncbi:2-acylglycerol O-acyltransferase 2-like [Dasypus novemcinctus]|uniref:2-acylglycerol O-acyltransferase 2-like n=1 Tax=Dasypus novemcinctus TaxID=9361 RepID=UPI00265FF965|nr:2-acylglycerol O-acyltransferase 2-like [Dasypus novemcinctus]
MVEFAPLAMPQERRLQTLAVLLWVFSFLVLTQLCIAAFIGLLCTRFWLCAVLYVAWWCLHRHTLRRGGRCVEAVRCRVLWKYLRDYFPTVLVKTAELDPSRNYVAGFHPHGILGTSSFLNLCTESTGFSALFPGIRPYHMTLPLFFRVPFLRDYFMFFGLVTSDKESGAHVLSRKEGGSLLAIVVGGAREMLDARPGAYTLLLRHRKGFVRLALEHGAALVPIFSFGENELYGQVKNPPGSWLRQIQNQLQQVMGFSLPLFHGRGVFQYSFGFVPYRWPITTVVGKPIEVQKMLHPSKEEVDHLHQRYLKELCNLFETHKLKYNVPADQHLEFC